MVETGTGRRAAIVTGASRGIGAAVARKLAGAGVDLVIGYRSDEAGAAEVVAAAQASGADAVAVAGDTADEGTAPALVRAALDRFGRLDVLVSNAGIEHFGAVDTITRADVDRVFGVNVAGQLFLVQAAVAAMGDGGRIVLTSSVSALIGVRHHTLYAASKAAVLAMARNLAPELGERGITINAIAPGGTQTDMAAEYAAHYTHPSLAEVAPEAVTRSMTSAGRWAEPEEIANVVAFLVSPEASYMSGSTVNIDGGWM